MQSETYQPQYSIGDRVFGHWGKIPFVGTVGNDSFYSHKEGPLVTVLLDLPISDKGKIITVVLVNHNDIRRLKKIDFE